MSIVLDHLLISLVGWFVGVIAGSAVGYLYAVAARALLTSSPNLRRWSTLIPWRTAVMGLLILTWTPNIVVRFGLGTIAGMVSTGLFIFLLSLPLTVTVLIEHWYPSLPAVRLVAGFRTLATASFVIAAGAGLFGGGGIGGFITQATNPLQSDLLLQAWLVVVVLILLADVLLGMAQMIVSNSTGAVQVQHAGSE